MTTSISDSGGYEGSNKILDLESKKGSKITFYYEHYSIPDRFYLIYEGNIVYDSGFVGGNRSETFYLPSGDATQLQVIVATDDEGTAWDYSIQATSSSTYPFILLANGDEFTGDATSTLFSGSGNITIGREDGIASLISVGNGQGTHDETSFDISGAYVFDIGGVSETIFTGSFSTTFANGGGAVDDQGGAGFMLGDMDINVKHMVINPQDIRIKVDFQLPQELGSYEFEGTTLIFDQNGVSLGVNGKVVIPDADFTFFELFEVKATDQSISYDHTERMVKYQAELTVEGFSKFFEGKSLTLDLKGENYVGIGASGPELKGELTYDNEAEFESWGLKQIKLSVDTGAGTIEGSATISLPMKVDVEGTLGISINSDHNLELNKIGIAVQEINKPLAFAPEFYLQSIGGDIDHIAQSDSDPIAFTGSIGFSAGPKIGGKNLATLDVQATVDENHIEGSSTLIVLDEEIFKSTGTMNWNWKDGYLTQSSTVSMFDGVLSGQTALKVNSHFDFSFGGQAAIEIPDWVPFLGGETRASTNYIVKFINDSDFSNDYLQAWYEGSFTVFGVTIDKKIGFRLNFDGSFSKLGFDDVSDIPTANAASFQATTAAEEAISGPLYLFASWTVGHNGTVALEVVDPNGNIYQESDFAAHGIEIIEEFDSDFGRTVAVQNPGTAGWHVQVVDPTGLGDMTYSAGTLGVDPTVSVLSLHDNNGVVDISYEWADVSASDTISFYYDVDGDGLDGFFIASIQAGTGTTGDYSWDARGVVPGSYFVYALVDGHDIVSVSDYSDNKVAVAADADLSVAITGPSADLAPNAPASYLITVSNSGATDASDIVVDDLVPEGWSVASSSLPVSRTADGHVYFDIPTLAAGQTIDISLVLEPGGTVETLPSDVDNSALSKAFSLDDLFTFSVDPNVESSDKMEHVSLAATGDGAPDYYAVTVEQAGDTLTFDIDATSGVDSYVILRDAAGNQMAYSDDNGGDPGSNSSRDSRLTYQFSNAGVYYVSVHNYPGSDTAGPPAGSSYRLNVSRPSDASVSNVIVNQVTVSSPHYDSNIDNDTAASYAAIGDGDVLASLSVSATAFDPTYSVGGIITSTITITNNGTSDVTGVTLSGALSNLPNDFIISDIDGDTIIDSDKFDLDLGDLAAGETRTLTISGVANAAGPLTARLDLTSDGNEMDYNDNEVELSTNVNPAAQAQADLSLQMDVLGRDTDGRQIVKITLGNDGPGIANGILVQAMLPGGMSISDIDLIQGTFDDQTGLWTVGNVRDGITRDLTFVIDSPTTAIALVKAEVSGSGATDPDSVPGGGPQTEDDTTQAYVALGMLTEVQGLLGGDGNELLRGGTGNDSIDAGAGNDAIFGGDGNDTLAGGMGDDAILAAAGDDKIDGGDGDDTAVFTGAFINYAITANVDGSFTIKDLVGTDGTDTLSNVEFWQFSDVTRAADVNDAPTSISLSNTTIAENALAGAVIGTLTAADPDVGDTVDFALVSNPGDMFEIINGQVVVAAGATLDFEKGNSYTIVVRGTDTGGLTLDQTVTIAVTNVNEAPTDISLSQTKIAENSKAGTLVGVLSAIDPDAGEAFTYTLKTDAGGTLAIVGNKLVVANGAHLDFETNKSYSITVTVSDSALHQHDETFEISVTDVSETIKGTGRNDNLKGTLHDDVILGQNGNDILRGLGGGDQLNGGKGLDTASYADAKKGVIANLANSGKNSGDADGDRYISIENLIGSKLNDSLIGNKGENHLDGGRGKDRLTGGGGSDTFIFGAGYGNDTVTDFVAKGKQHDVLDLSDAAGITNFNDLMKSHVKVIGDDLHILAADKSMLVLFDVDKGDLSKSDFLF